MNNLDQWIADEARFAASAMLGAISATQLVKERPGFGQRMVPRPGSILASPVPAAYDPDPDYFFHWFRDSAIVIDALREALAEGLVENAVLARLQEFVEFTLSLRSLDGGKFLQQGDFRAKVQPFFLQFVRPDAEIAAVSGATVLGEARVNPDGTLDFSRWSRPQADGPALRSIVLLRWWARAQNMNPALRSAMHALVHDDLAFTLSHAQKPSFDIWEEESGYHYYTQLVQGEALIRGSEWLEETGDTTLALACRAAAADIALRLDALWSDAAGFYRSRSAVTDGKAGKDVDIAVILAVLHVRRASGAHSVIDPRAQATLTILEELFETDYSINHNLSAERGPAMGRYANDAYYSGGAYYFATLATAEFYFSLASAILSGADMAATDENRHFRRRLAAEAATESRTLAEAAIQRGDAFMRTVQEYTPIGGELSEQFDHVTGAQTSAKHLAWSYAAFITAASARAQAIQAISGANPLAKPADTA